MQPIPMKSDVRGLGLGDQIGGRPLLPSKADPKAPLLDTILQRYLTTTRYLQFIAVEMVQGLCWGMPV
jgi:hypothetical protein